MPLLNFPYTGRTQRITIPSGYKPRVTVYLWGAGGGSGGNDTGSGGNGACGNAVKVVLDLTPGDVLEFGLGNAGAGGLNGARVSGGAAGASYISTANDRYGGGIGGTSGRIGRSGSGGGGGGASVLLLNGTIIAVAGGGGGGGGGGNVGTIRGQDASATPSTGSNNSTTGQNGQGKDGDGGGGGGGGGGRYGGVFGGLRSGDQGALAGGTGSSFTTGTGPSIISMSMFTGSGVTPPSIDGYTVSPTYATGGISVHPTSVASGTRGTPGHMMLSIDPIGLPYVKVDGAWKPVINAYIKSGNSWQEFNENYIKIGNNWKVVEQRGTTIDPTSLAADLRYGAGGTRAAPADGS